MRRGSRRHNAVRIVALHRYPVKSLGGHAMSRAPIEPRGLQGDRRWMMVTPDGRFLTRREVPAMAHVHADLAPGGLVLTHRDADTCAVAEPGTASHMAVRVWGDTVQACDAGDAVAHWLSAIFARPVRLVHMPDAARRPVDPKYAQDTDQVGFADGFPVLVTTVESLDALNRQLANPITMARFRPNLVIAGAPAAFAEDDWNVLRIGAITLRVANPCTRCVMTTQDPDSGDVVEKMEPLRTLRAMGRVTPGLRSEPVFGQNAIPDGAGMIAVGDAVDLIA
jgi:uncharacterized protein YcbX